MQTFFTKDRNSSDSSFNLIRAGQYFVAALESCNALPSVHVVNTCFYSRYIPLFYLSSAFLCNKAFACLQHHLIQILDKFGLSFSGFFRIKQSGLFLSLNAEHGINCF